jgi:hypothetical protein
MVAVAFPAKRVMAFSLAAQRGFFYSDFFAVAEPVKVPDKSHLAGAEVSDWMDLTKLNQ